MVDPGEDVNFIKIMEHYQLPLEGRRVHFIRPTMQPRIKICNNGDWLPNILVKRARDTHFRGYATGEQDPLNEIRGRNTT